MAGLSAVKRANWLITCDEAMSVQSDGVLAVGSDGNVAYAGSYRDAPAHIKRSASSHPSPASGSIILPGFVNSHAHTPMTLLRSAGDGLPIDRWLHEVIWPAERQMTDDDAYHGTVVGIAEMLASGITASAEMYRFEGAVAQAFINVGMRAVIAPTIFGLDVEQRLGAIDELREQMSKEPLIEVAVGLHAIYSCGVDVCREGFAHAAATGMSTHIHLAETAGEARDSDGVSAVDKLCMVGMLETDVNAAHGIMLDRQDIEKLAASDHHVGISHCPISNMSVGGGVAADIVNLLEGGLTVGIGTDGPGSAGQLDMFESMRSALLNARHVRADPSAITAEAVLRAATVGSARTAGLPVGSLDAGKPADFSVMYVGSGSAAARFAGRLDTADQVISAVVWQGRPEDIKEVWLGGEMVAQARFGAGSSGWAAPNRLNIERSIAYVNRRRRELLS